MVLGQGLDDHVPLAGPLEQVVDPADGRVDLDLLGGDLGLGHRGLSPGRRRGLRRSRDRDGRERPLPVCPHGFLPLFERGGTGRSSRIQARPARSAR